MQIRRMRAVSISASLLFAVLLTSTSTVCAKAPKAAAGVRDGSTRDRAIIVTEREATYVQWESRYLDKHFPGHAPVAHHVAADAATRRVWELHTFTWHGQGTTIWFDVTQPFNEFTRAHRQ